MTTGQAVVFVGVIVSASVGFLGGVWLFYDVWLPWRERRQR